MGESLLSTGGNRCQADHAHGDGRKVLRTNHTCAEESPWQEPPGLERVFVVQKQRQVNFQSMAVILLDGPLLCSHITHCSV